MEMKKFFVQPSIPERLKDLSSLALNLWSYWDKDAERLFSRIDTLLYSQSDHNLAEMLQKVKPDKLERLSQDKGFSFELEKVWNKYSEYMDFEGTYINRDGVAFSPPEAFGETGPGDPPQVGEIPFRPQDTIAYFSMEYGLHESIPIYSGGLGILSGDHLKAASDIGISLVGVGLLYKYGYFNQRINFNGYQEEDYRENEWYRKAIRELKDKDGNPVYIQVPLKRKLVYVKAWVIQVGKVPLYLLDTDIPLNPPEVRVITDMLYDANREMRIQQELILGRGGVILLKFLGYDPKVYHLNEGHSAFLIFERLKEFILLKKMGFEEARNLITHTTVFTTHTPVIEGNEHFPATMIAEYLEPEIREMGLSVEEFLSFGRNQDPAAFWLPQFAMNFSRFINGVSKIHGEVSRRMWRDVYPNLPEQEVPIGYITNGVHVQTWLSMEMTYLFDRYIGPDYLHRAEGSDVWERIYSAPDAEVWAAHQRRKEQLISFIRDRKVLELQKKGATLPKIGRIRNLLNPRDLTIGFARRFAPYKRANLILQDPERLVKILTNPQRPVQIIFAGKAHPADQAGKELIKEILDVARRYDVENRLVFVEDYNINVAKHLVQGVDIWLNNPLKPMEASGTSGMKAAINGALNLSVLDGWWPEGYDGRNGWAITAGEIYENETMKRMVESNQVYDLLEQEITELYYDRNESDVPEGWVQMMKNSISTVGKGFNMHRVLREYFYQYYLPELKASTLLQQEERKLLKELEAHRKKIELYWSKISIRDFFLESGETNLCAGQSLELKAYVFFDQASEKDWNLEVVYSPKGPEGEWTKAPMDFIKMYDDNVAEYRGRVQLQGAGVQGITVRLRPSWNLFCETYPNYVKWK